MPSNIKNDNCIFVEIFTIKFYSEQNNGQEK